MPSDNPLESCDPAQKILAIIDSLRLARSIEDLAGVDEIDAALGEDDSRGAVQSLVARQRLGNLDYDEVSALFRNPTLRRSLREVLREFPEAEAVVREEVPFVWHMLSQGRGRDLGFEIGL